MTSKALSLFDTSIGKKVVMAVSGVILFGFTIGHMLGNLLIFAGRDLVNAYSAAIHANLPLLWGTRALLLASVAAHVVVAFRLNAENRAARPVAYKVRHDDLSTYASRTMQLSGPLLLVYVFYHLSHLTFGTAQGAYEHSATDVYANLVNGFSIWWVTAIYVVANLALGLHLRHGAWSFLQSLGLNHPRYNDRLRAGTRAFALAVTIGNVTIPLTVLLGFVQ